LEAKGKVDRVLDRLGQAIIAGRYAAGDKLPTEDELARQRQPAVAARRSQGPRP
jgi:DNA-binding FadR family transcriptional regulator